MASVSASPAASPPRALTDVRRRSWRRLALAIALALAVAAPFLASNYHVFQFTAGAGLRDRAPRAQHADRLQRPDLARPRRLLCDRRLCGGDPVEHVRRALLGDHAGRRRGLPRGRLPVRPAGAAPRRPLSRARHLRAGAGDAADAEIQGVRALDRRRAGHRARQARRALRPAARRRPVALFLLPRPGAAAVLARAGTCCAAGSGARWWRSATIRSRRRPWASTPRSTSRSPSASAPSIPASPARSARIVVQFVAPDSFSILLSITLLVGIVVGGLASISGAFFGALFIAVRAELSPTRSPIFWANAPRRCPGRSTALLLIGFMYVMPTGVAGLVRSSATQLAQRRSRPR